MARNGYDHWAQVQLMNYTGSDMTYVTIAKRHAGLYVDQSQNFWHATWTNLKADGATLDKFEVGAVGFGDSRGDWWLVRFGLEDGRECITRPANNVSLNIFRGFVYDDDIPYKARPYTEELQTKYENIVQKDGGTMMTDEDSYKIAEEIENNEDWAGFKKHGISSGDNEVKIYMREDGKVEIITNSGTSDTVYDCTTKYDEDGLFP